MNAPRPSNRWASVSGWFLAVAGLSLLLGCSTIHDMFGGSPPPPKPKVTATTTEDEVAGRLRAGDQLQIRIDAGPQLTQAPTPTDCSIDEDGNISLPLVGHIKAAGLTPSELAEHIQANYMPRYYVRCTATVLVASRFFYVGGEVRNPNRFLWSEDTTVLKALSTASGFTDYANRRKVELVRGKDRQVLDCEEMQRHPSKDLPVRPGDTITVLRSIF